MTQIVQLKIENFKRLTAAEISPDGNVVIISGANAQGKSSVLDAFMFALGGPSLSKAITRPIRDGEEKASVFVDLGDFTVERTCLKGKPPTVKVMSKYGAKYPSPQKFLDEKLGQLSFDPLAFTLMKPKEQLSTLLGLVELPFDPDEIEGRKLAIFDERTDVNREVKTLQGRVSAAERPEGPEVTETSVSEAIDAYAAAQRAHTAYEKEYNAEHEMGHRIQELRDQLTELVDQWASQATLVSKLEGELPDLDAAKTQMDTAEERNREIRTDNEARKLWADLDAKIAESESLTDQIKAIDKEKSEALAAAKMPIEGLGFDAEGVLYQGVPFDQASSAEKLRVSIAMAIAMNPEIRVIRITDGSLLDSENMALVCKMADEADCQVWIERVDESGEIGFVIEDGMVKA